MPEERLQRRLAAILAADVVGYSRLMQANEAGTLAALKTRQRETLEPLVAKYRGRVVKLMGDGVLTEFSSAVDAVECAVRLQEAMDAANTGLSGDKRIVLRIGVNLGDVLVEGDDLYGDGVNIAARLEALADPGGVLVSETVFGHVRGKVEFGFEDLGEQLLKNMVERLRVYKVSTAVASTSQHDIVGEDRPSRFSIAVLPFINMSGDLEQEYFSDGITEDIITDLSKVTALSVLSRNTTFALKGKTIDISQIARQLRVGYVVEGSVRRAGGRVRITAQLIDAMIDSHVWAERYDRDVNDIFMVQDEISQAIVTALKVKLLPDERAAIEKRSTKDPAAYELYLLARAYQTQGGARPRQIALRFCKQALAIDPGYARAWAFAAICETYLYTRGRSKESGMLAAEKALSLDPTLAEAHSAKGVVLCHIGHYAEAMAAHEESLRIDPDSFEVRRNFGMTCMYAGCPEEAIKHLERAASLLQTDYNCQSMVVSCYHALGRHDEAKAAARRSLLRIEAEIALRPDNAHALAEGACDLAYLGENERARGWIARVITIASDDATDYYNLACVLAQLNEPNQALDVLEQHARMTPPERIYWIKRDVDLEPLRDQPRYQALIAEGEERLAQALAAQAPKMD